MVELVTFRVANYETPLWAVENFSAGRYNDAFRGYAQYLSLHPMTPWAEVLRNEDRRTRERAVLMRYPLWALRVTLDVAPFEVTFDGATALDLTPSDLVADDHAACRSLADTFRAAGSPSAFFAPSAALPGTRNLVLLDPRVLSSWELVPLDALDLPGALAAQDGRCPEGLWDHVHYRGSSVPHAGLEAWERGEEFAFVEPLVTSTSLVS